MKKHKFGFTLVETIVALGIIAILIAALVPSMSSLLPGVQLNGTTRNLVGDLRKIQELAITEQNQHLIRFYPQNSPPKYELIRIANGNEQILINTDFPQNQTLTLQDTIVNNQIVFSPDGGPSNTGNITISNSNSSKVINVSPAGYIKIQ